ncbi:MAG: hypothetical protein FD155_3365 [Bacteroidetes bacterium]|nr:MAG: hypothetical protein FD155_3365 [Bacteroidota bacterium]
MKTPKNLTQHHPFPEARIVTRKVVNSERFYICLAATNKCLPSSYSSHNRASIAALGLGYKLSHSILPDAQLDIFDQSSDASQSLKHFINLT